MKYDIIIVGGGIVGLATAYQLLLARPSLKLLLIEKENAIAKHQTGNNSGVIHSGIYYKPKSLKATNCIRGYGMLLDFCEKENIAFDKCGKIIVATKNEELPALKTIYDRGLENGLTGMINIKKEEIADYEPHVKGVAGIFVPQTGIIDYKTVCQKLAQKIEKLGGYIHLSEKVEDIKLNDEKNGNSTFAKVITSNSEYQTSLVVNCAGLYSDKVTKMTMPDAPIKIIPFRGEYYKLVPEKKHLVKNLIYPVPDSNFPFLGVHFTRMINGEVEAGPNAVLAYKREGYKKTDISIPELLETLTFRGFQKVALKYWKTGFGEIHRSYSKDAFTKALQELIPEVQKQDLITANAGVRAQACDKDGGLLDDFKILEKQGVINVVNAPSPAATSSLSIGKTISEMALSRI
ncbi:putative dehydrogenase [Bernardetia litoralis DSM 6794]|uniref:Putative dehydrogenase n=1 Tax=Bernardetia litoralis (strain ATCC 23117 / DSM 6794 / NBRC 15988 / NCIMB 1366 / Fx l1 / Sio-4) TaxID=880071 RepID=I4ANY9_BERLS|nr:L-2-hydroxyglutarate oxidase [Bernardetia litoralis]AFM05674.1 putative dehydrogenase [Bernardetia litoralis DSM 6794]